MRPLTQNMRPRAHDNFIDCARDGARDLVEVIESLRRNAADLVAHGRYSAADDIRDAIQWLEADLQMERDSYYSRIDGNAFPKLLADERLRRICQQHRKVWGKPQ